MRILPPSLPPLLPSFSPCSVSHCVVCVRVPWSVAETILTRKDNRHWEPVTRTGNREQWEDHWEKVTHTGKQEAQNGGIRQKQHTQRYLPLHPSVHRAFVSDSFLSSVASHVDHCVAESPTASHPPVGAMLRHLFLACIALVALFSSPAFGHVRLLQTGFPIRNAVSAKLDGAYSVSGPCGGVSKYGVQGVTTITSRQVISLKIGYNGGQTNTDAQSINQ